MSKFSSKAARPNVTAAVATAGERASTFEGHLGYVRDAKSELFLLAVSNLVAEDTFYERPGERDARFKVLVHQCATEDPDWTARFIGYLRETMQMRSAAVVAAAHYVAAGAPHGRRVVSSALVRADEPAEILAYWAQEYGRAFPQPLKRGVADSVRRLYTERNALKYDGQSRAWRMADVVELVHPRPVAPWQSELFRWLLDRRRARPEASQWSVAAERSLVTIGEHLRLQAMPIDDRRQLIKSETAPEVLERAAFTWEALSGWLQGPMDANAWEAVIPSMGYMALLRNLRNFEEAGVAESVLQQVAIRLADPEQVRRSRQFPFRFYSAWQHLPSERFAYPLELALEHSLANVPALRGRTLILVDLSGSMRKPISRQSRVNWWEIAALFGLALGKRADAADLVVYSIEAADVQLTGPILRSLDAVGRWPGAFQGTDTFGTLQRAYDGHDRIVIVTDEQAHPGSHDLRSPRAAYAEITCPIYTFNGVGYRVGHLEAGEKGRYTIGGLTDAGFRILQLLDEQRSSGWPF